MLNAYAHHAVNTRHNLPLLGGFVKSKPGQPRPISRKPLPVLKLRRRGIVDNSPAGGQVPMQSTGYPQERQQPAASMRRRGEAETRRRDEEASRRAGQSPGNANLPIRIRVPRRTFTALLLEGNRESRNGRAALEVFVVVFVAIPAPGCWLLPPACWLLASGCCLMAAGCWLLAFVRRWLPLRSFHCGSSWVYFPVDHFMVTISRWLYGRYRIAGEG